ncbi:hypothetical protein COO60DRAFT_1665172 [Scenedesmus sp. NREL 46B-D3]|nr:hypothetical protein COO60DRAFT_1665172 [Scenedesmus sp. NREL 46B-D3]
MKHCQKLGRSLAACTFASNAIQSSVNGNTGKRAGNLCSKIRRACHSTNDCDHIDLMCDLTSTTGSICTCDAVTGSDTCVRHSGCVRTPCKICADCLGQVAPFTYAQRYNSDKADIAASFNTYCTGLGNWTAAQRSAVAAQIAAADKASFGKRAAGLCRGLGLCNATSMGAACQLKVNATLAPSSLDSCAVEGVAAGGDVPGSSRALALPQDTCDNDIDCQQADPERMCVRAEAPVSFCTCSVASGIETCRNIGGCADTPCKSCRLCLQHFQSFVNAPPFTATTGPDEVAAAFSKACAATNKYSAPACESARVGIANSFRGNAGRRAGSICRLLGDCNPARLSTDCSALQQCSNLQSDCRLKAEAIGVDTSSLDLCSVEGVDGGTALKDVVTVAGVPAGRCLTDADCSADMQCNTGNTTRVLRCSAGLDTAMSYGLCVAKPPPPALVTPCERCSSCITAIKSVVDAANASSSQSAGSLAAGFSAWCSAQNTYPLTSCRAVQTSISDSFNGNLARRAGALCTRLGECSSSVAADSACRIVTGGNATLTGQLDACTVEGVSTGVQVQGTFTGTGMPPGACVLDSDCDSSSSCSSDQVTTICRCMGGTDSCDSLSTCKARPAPPPPPAPVAVVSPCKRCESCLKEVQGLSAAQGVAASTDAVTISGRFLAACTSSFARGDTLLCREVSSAIAFSYQGNLAKRAGALCKRLGNCTDDLTAAGSTCTLAASTQLSGRLDLCTREGVAGATGVAGVLSSTAGLEPGTCQSTTDCRAPGTVCSMAEPVLRCTCSGGTDREMRVQLGASATLMPGSEDTLGILANQTALFDVLNPAAKFTGSSKVAMCSNCQGPTAALIGPQVVPEPCNPASASDIKLDASFSKDASGRPLAKISWSQRGSSDMVLRAAIDRSNAANSGTGDVRLVIPAAGLPSMAAGTYAVEARVTSFLGASDTASLAFEKVGPGEAPVVSVIGENPQEFRIADGVKVSAQLLATSVCSGKRVEYTWESMDDAPWAAVPANYRRKDLVIAAPVPGVTAGDTKKLRLRASYDFGTVNFKAGSSYGLRSLAASSTAPTFTFTGLPAGEATLYVCAVDADGAQTCEDAKVVVKEPPTSFKVTDALSALDVGQLAGSGDVSVLAAGAQALQSLSEFASKAATSDTAGPAAVPRQSAEEQKQVQSAIAAKTKAMISSLASSAGSLVDDPQSMSQVVSAVAVLSRTTNKLSSETKSKMLEVASSGIISAHLSKQSLTPNQGSRLLAVVAAGNGVSSACKLPSGCVKVTASAAKGSRHLLAVQDAVSCNNAIHMEAGSPAAARQLQRRLMADNATTADATAGTTVPALPSATRGAASTAGFLAPLLDVAGLLATSATPATGYLSGGDNGLYVSVANLLGRTYPNSPLYVGPDISAAGAASAISSDNVHVAFSKPLTSLCVDEAGDSVANSSCSDGVVPVQVMYLSESSPLLAAGATRAAAPAQGVPEQPGAGADGVQAGDSKGATSQASVIAGSVAGAVGGAMLLAGAALHVLKKRKFAAVEPRIVAAVSHQTHGRQGVRQAPDQAGLFADRAAGDDADAGSVPEPPAAPANFDGGEDEAWHADGSGPGPVVLWPTMRHSITADEAGDARAARSSIMGGQRRSVEGAGAAGQRRSVEGAARPSQSREAPVLHQAW